MSRRRLSRRQQGRIEAAQDAWRDSDAHQQGLVVSHQGGRILVELDPSTALECKIKSNLGSVVCGDQVVIETTAQGEHRALAILERDNLLQRIDGYGKARAVAANISQLVVCLATLPEPNLFLLDQYLVAAEQQAVDAVIVLNKTDLPGSAPIREQIERVYAPLGYRVIGTSVENGLGMEAFRKLLVDELSVLCGVSGVGKSSLTHWLLPDEPIRIADISNANEEGRHTTRSSRLYHLPGGGDLIDTPGVRGFTPFIDDASTPTSGFREISEHAGACRFNDCRHLDEPGCAVTEARADGRIDESRYQSYLKLLEQVADN